MLKKTLIGALPVLLAALMATGAARAGSIWFSPLTAYTRTVPPIKLTLERGNFNALGVRADGPITEGTQAVNIPLAVPPGRVTSVEVCYRVNTTRVRTTYIARMTLSSMAKPEEALPVLEDLTDLWSTTSKCYTSRQVIPDYANVDGALRLSLMMVFGSADDVVLIGGIKLTMEDEPRLLPRR